MTLKKIALLGFTALHLCSGGAWCAEGSGAILKPDALRNYVAAFNSQRPDDTAEGLPADGSVTAISNTQASDWMERNVPLFECSDKDIEETYYFRWWTYRKHIWKTPDGFVVTEFLPKVSWSKKYNTINCPVGHQLYEGRWLRDPKIINDYTQFHFGKGGDPGGSSKMYSQWITDGIYAHYLVNADKLFVSGLLDALVKNHEAWKQGNPALHPWQRSRLLDNGLYWQVDSWEGQEFSIGGTGIRPPMNAYMFGEAVAIAKIAELAGKKELAEHYRAEAEQLRKQVQDRLWDSDAKFFKVMRHEMAPMNQYSNSVAEACEPGQLVKVREIFGLVPWYFNLPESGHGYEEAWRQLIDPQGFLGLYGPTVAERRHPKFFINAAGCMWCGASWPFSTAQTLTALANVLNNYSQDVIGKKEYFDTLKAYTRSHRLTLDDGRVVSWLDESLNPDTGRWMKVGPFPKTRGRDYNHSTYCDLVITGLVGLRPRADDLVEVNPLVPEGTLEYFCLDNISYHGRNLTIVWDKTGKQYGRGVGLRVLSDGQEIAHSETMTRVTGKLPNRYPDQRLPGIAKAIVQGNTRRLQNDQVSFQFDVTNGQVKDVRFKIKGEPGSTVLINELFALIVDGKPVNASAMKLDAVIPEETIPADPASPRLGDHSSAQSFALTFAAPDDSYRIVWKSILRDESNYILFDVMVTPLRGDLGLNRLALLDVTAKNMKQMGTPAGSPVVNDRFFFGYHHPTTRSLIAGDHLTFYWDRSNMAVKKGESVHQRAVIGIYPKEQLRRAFNYYLERERSQAYHQVLHYNAWYDILHTARTKKADEAEAVQRIEIITKELTVKRGVPVKSFMFDDPWDNVSGTATDVWQFDPKRNPNEWKGMNKVAQKHGSALGVWMSPQGGWGGRQVRLATAQKNSLPYVIKDKAFSLSDPAYLARFREVCFDFLRNQGVNMFKFDGFNEQPKNESEREALVKLIEDMRKEKPDVFINTTCGSWPSPFFLMNSDSIWRGGGDIELKGVGPVREQALTYRDWTTYRNVVFQSPLFPISSVMLHGVVLAPYVHHKGFDTTTVQEWKNEVRSYFGIGVNLQELYIAPDNPDTGKALMTDELWNIVAEGARWARANEDVLVDAHWVGGDPGYGRVYGVASWSPTKATLMLRNPSDQPQSIDIEPEKVFELPAYVMDRTFTLKSPWADEAGKPAITLTAGKIHTFTLEPFEVLVLERK